MTSPFPGMDPYLERNWLDVHSVFVVEARRELNRSLPAGLIARAEERIAVESGGEDFETAASADRLVPDVRVFSPSTADPEEGTGGVVIDAPFKLVVQLDPITERYIRIIDESGELVTVIEFVSPTNKRDPGLRAFREKRAELITAGVHVVEIDLVRAGNWRALMRPEVCPPEAVSLYRATVRTSGRRPGAYLFPITLRAPLPEIPIPLRPGDRPARLPLQSLFNAVYVDGRYEQSVDYSRPLDPPLTGEDAAWAEELLRAAGRR